jgi:glycosyltransferase involved in cell wall biosynthesis
MSRPGTPGQHRFAIDRTGRMKKIRILQVVPGFRTGGAERVVLDLLRFLDRDQFEVAALSVYPRSDSDFEREALGMDVPVFYLNKRPGAGLSCLRAADELVQRWQPEVVHTHGYALAATLPACVRRRVRVRVHTLHCSPNFEEMGWRRQFRHIAYHHLGVIPVSISAGVHQTLKKLYGKLNSPLIHNGVNTELYKPRPRERVVWRESNGIGKDEIVIICTGNINPNKNQHLLLNAFCDVAASVPRALLILVGDGPSRAGLEERARQLGLGSRVRFLGERHDVADILNGSDIFALCSNSEGLPLSILEAMATRKPVVATITDGSTEILGGNEAGLLVPLDDREGLAKALTSLCTSSDFRESLAKLGREIVLKSFDVVQMAKQYGELYLQAAR